MAASFLSPKNPLLLVGLVGLVAYVLARRAQGATLAPKADKRRVDYATPQLVAETIGGLVVGWTKNLQAQPSEAARLTNAEAAAKTQGLGLIRALEGAYYGATSTDDDDRSAVNRAMLRAADADYYGWSGVWSAPQPSAVRAPAGDSLFGGGIFDTGDDFTASPSLVNVNGWTLQ